MAVNSAQQTLIESYVSVKTMFDTATQQQHRNNGLECKLTITPGDETSTMHLTNTTGVLHTATYPTKLVSGMLGGQMILEETQLDVHNAMGIGGDYTPEETFTILLATMKTIALASRSQQ